jgi:hypothetical protein
VTTLGRLLEPERFENIVVKRAPMAHHARARRRRIGHGAAFLR